MQEIEKTFRIDKILVDSNLRFADSRYRNLFESANDGIIILNADDLKIVDINLSASDLLGLSRERLTGENICEIQLFKADSEFQKALSTLRVNGFVQFKDLALKNTLAVPVVVEFTAKIFSDGDELLAQCYIRKKDEQNFSGQKTDSLQNTSLVQVAGKVARLGGWTLDVADWNLTWSDENCAIHEVPAGYKPTLSEGIGYFPEEYQSQVKEYVRKCAQDGTPYDFELPKYTAKGNLIWVRSIGEAVRDANGKIIRLQGAFQDITAQKKIEQDLLQSREQYRQMVDHASDIILKTDAAGRFVFVNPSVGKILKYTQEEFLTLHYLDLVREDFRQQLKRALTRQFLRKTPNTYFEFIALTSDGEEIWIGQHTQLLANNERIMGFQAICRDITQKKQTEEELRNLSLTDELTGLYNRRGFLALAEHQLKLALNKKIEKKLLVIYADLDGLKQINDTYGHDEGSRAIVATAELLRQSFRQSDLVARLGGDEFVVLAIEANEENTEMIINRMQSNFHDYNARKNHPFDLSFSFGIARFESETNFKIESLMNHADQEMYKNKRDKRRPIN